VDGPHEPIRTRVRESSADRHARASIGDVDWSRRRTLLAIVAIIAIVAVGAALVARGDDQSVPATTVPAQTITDPHDPVAAPPAPGLTPQSTTSSGTISPDAESEVP
jgi:hypothetical protein